MRYKIEHIDSGSTKRHSRVMRMTLEIVGTEYEITHSVRPLTARCKLHVKTRERLVVYYIVQDSYNGHVGSDMIGYEGIHGGHGVGAPNEEGINVLGFATVGPIPH